MASAVELLGPDGPLAAALPGYEQRDVQLRMAEVVEDTLAHRGIALCEAGTGTGKTLAYLVPALLSGRRVVVSTGTRTLQDQIMAKDVPLLQRHIFGAVRVQCMKGLSNYLCLRRYNEFMASARVQKPEVKTHLPLLTGFADQTNTGDWAELQGVPEAVRSMLLPAVSSGSDTRIGSRCSYYDACHITRMRRSAADAQLIVVNHHLLFADLALKDGHGGGVIPPYDALILDEAHLVEDVATEFFGTSISDSRFAALCKDAEQVLSRSAAVLSAQRWLAEVESSAHEVFSGLLPHMGPEGQRAPLDLAILNGPLQGAFLALDDALAVLGAECQALAGEGEVYAQLTRRVAHTREDLGWFIDVDQGAQVVWGRRNRRSVTLGRSPVDVGPVLQEHLFQRDQATLFVSATLSTSGDFSFIKNRLGIDFEVDELALPSPFDYARCAALYLPDDMPDYRDSGFQGFAVERLIELVEVTGGGALVLCTALRSMRALHRQCRGRLRQPVYMQGDAPHHELLERLRKDGNGVLFATASFWQGVDIPGDALRLVVIDKLPFEVPSDPLVQARCERLTADGQSAFMRYLVPSAALSLKQGFGRLIRSAKDRGIVAILDRRLTSKGYGKVFLRSLPPARLCRTMEDVQAFWLGQLESNASEQHDV